MSHKKQVAKLLSISLLRIDRFSKSLHCCIQQEIYNKMLQISPHLKDVTTLPSEILVFKNSTDRKHTNGRQVRMQWREGDRIRWAGNKPISQPHVYCLTHQTAQSGVVQIIFSTAILVWSVLRDTCWRTDWSKWPCCLYTVSPKKRHWCYTL